MPAKPSGSAQEEEDDSGSSHGYSEVCGRPPPWRTASMRTDAGCCAWRSTRTDTCCCAAQQNGDRSTPDARQPGLQQHQPDPAVVQQQLQQQYQLAAAQAAYNAQIPGLAMQQPLSQDQSLAQQPQLQMPHQQMPHPLGYGHDPASALFLQPGMQQQMQHMHAQLAMQGMNPGQLQMQQGQFPADMAAHLNAHQGMPPMRTGMLPACSCIRTLKVSGVQQAACCLLYTIQL